jgi:hypothetical protein
MLKMCGASLPLAEIMERDLPGLKGVWEGMRSGTEPYFSTPIQGRRTILEIKTDSLPIHASFFFHETKRGILEYPIVFEIRDGKLVSRKYHAVLTLCKKEGRVRLMGQMDAGRRYEAFLFWKAAPPFSFHSLASVAPHKGTGSSMMIPPDARKESKLRL